VLAAILTIGNELVSGDTENTNASWLARRLESLGVQVVLSAAVPDETDRIVEFLRREAVRVDHLIVTGGLGGTPDDITRESLVRIAERIRANTRGEDPPFIGRETDEINAELQATRAETPWPAVLAEADAVTAELEREIRDAGPTTLAESGGLIGGIFGNGSSHAMTHFGWLVDARIGIDEARVAAFVDAQERLLNAAAIPDFDRGVGLYNLACAHAVAGRLDRARPLLPVAFRLRPDLAEFAKEDPDLVELRDELSSLSGDE